MSDIKKQIHELFGVQEYFELPNRIMEVINGEKFESVKKAYLERFPDLSRDVLREYFEECGADRQDFMQDYTPDSICQIMAVVTNHHLNGRKPYNYICDVCAGTGSLTIAMWNMDHNAIFFCYEKSKAAIPFLIFNMAVRGIEGVVINCDFLNRTEYEPYYDIHEGMVDRWEGLPEVGNCDAVIMNPPFSMKYSGKLESEFPAPPKSKADFAFIIKALELLKPNGHLITVAPHGLLFRSGSEGKIREKLLTEGYIKSVTGLPGRLFANTDIPVCIIEMIKPDDVRSSEGVHFTDASKLGTKRDRRMVLEETDIGPIIDSIIYNQVTDRFSAHADDDEIMNNDYNLNIPRYVDTSEPEEHIDLGDTMADLVRLQKEAKQINSRLNEMISQLVSTTDKLDDELERFKDAWHEYMTI